jgi:[acyl-carrier-protein] S-malonyltransferase
VKIAFLFPGQGSQGAGMVDPWLNHPAGKDIVERSSAVLGWDVAATSRDPKALERTEVVQLAVFVCDLAAHGVLTAEGVRCDIAAGHSLGEYAALVAAGVVELEPGLEALAARAEVIGVSPEEAADICAVAGRGDVLAVANENSAKQTVLSGSVSAVERAEELARSRGAKAVRLSVAGAFHSPLMEPALGPVREVLSRVQFHVPSFPIVPNVSATPTTQPSALRDCLSRHLISPVRWDATMRAMEDAGVTWFVETGPGDVLAKLARRAVPGSVVRAVGSPDEARAVADEVRREQDDF